MSTGENTFDKPPIFAELHGAADKEEFFKLFCKPWLPDVFGSTATDHFDFLSIKSA